MDYKDFLTAIANLNIKNAERVVALLWFHTISDDKSEMNPREICYEFEDVGYGKQNITRTKQALTRDPRVVKARNGGFRLNPKARVEL